MPQPEHVVIRAARSVLDYETEDALRKALMSVNLNDLTGETIMDESGDEQFDSSLDWVLPTVDPETTEVQSMQQEIRRLMVLKSYEVLDTEREEAFDRITGMTARIFKAPVALISLIDLGRGWFLSNRGMEGATETPRKVSFCSHAALLKNNILLVLDATKDFRFQNNPLVVGEPHIRFYAGAPLIAPEGYKLGALCLVDFEPRSVFTADDQATLMDMAKMVVDEMVHRRQAKRQAKENTTRFISYTANDLMTPLNGVQLSLSLLASDEEMKRKLSYQQAELLTTASTCSELMIRICKSATDALQEGDSSDLFLDSDMLEHDSADILPVTKIEELIKSLRMLTEPIPKKVPLVIRIDPTVPPLILCDDLKLFRAALNLLSSAIHRSQKGVVTLTIAPGRGRAELGFTVEDTADDIPVDEYPYLFKPCKREDGSFRMCLSSVASLVASLGGEYGFRPRVDRSVKQSGPRSRHRTGSVFWFSVPLFAPESLGGANIQLPSKNHGLFTGCLDSASSSCLSAVKSWNKPSESVSSHWRGSESNVPHPEVFNRSGTEGIMPTMRNGTVGTMSMGAMSALNPTKETLQPVVETVATSDTAATAPSTAQRVRKALVIDDSLVIRKSLGIALSKVGYEVTHATNGWEGLVQLKETVFDVVLCDVLMPIMDGHDCVRQYREWEQKRRPSLKQVIIGISAHATPDAASLSLRSGMDDFRAKPISVKNLAEILESAEIVSLAKALDVASELDMEIETIPKPRQQPLVDGEGTDDADSRRRDTEDGYSSTSTSEDGKKRRRTGSTMSGAEQLVCLVATDRPSTVPSDAFRELEQLGWKIVVVHDSNDAMRLLKMRNWDLVLIDDDLDTTGTQSVAEFRSWELEHRATRQRNVVLVSDMDIPSPDDKHAFIQPPNGFNSAISKPIAWLDVKYLLKASRSAGADFTGQSNFTGSS